MADRASATRPEQVMLKAFVLTVVGASVGSTALAFEASRARREPVSFVVVDSVAAVAWVVIDRLVD